MSGDLLAEAQALSAQLFGPDPVADAAAGIGDLEMLEPVPAGEPESEPDPDAAKPYAMTGGRVHEYLQSDLPEVAGRLGEEGASQVADTLSQLPRDLLHVMDGYGLFKGELSHDLLATINRNAARADESAVFDGELNPDMIEASAADLGFEISPRGAANVAVFVNSLPPAVRAGISPAMVADADLWDLAGILTRMRFGHDRSNANHLFGHLISGPNGATWLAPRNDAGLVALNA